MAGPRTDNWKAPAAAGAEDGTNGLAEDDAGVLAPEPAGDRDADLRGERVLVFLGLRPLLGLKR